MSPLTSFLQPSCSRQGVGSVWVWGAPSLCCIRLQKLCHTAGLEKGVGICVPPPVTTGDIHLAGGWHCVLLQEGSHQCRDLHGDTLAHLGKHRG